MVGDRKTIMRAGMPSVRRKLHTSFIRVSKVPSARAPGRALPGGSFPLQRRSVQIPFLLPLLALLLIADGLGASRPIALLVAGTLTVAGYLLFGMLVPANGESGETAPLSAASEGPAIYRGHYEGYSSTEPILTQPVSFPGTYGEPVIFAAGDDASPPRSPGGRPIAKKGIDR